MQLLNDRVPIKRKTNLKSILSYVTYDMFAQQGFVTIGNTRGRYVILYSNFEAVQIALISSGQDAMQHIIWFMSKSFGQI